MFASHVSDEKGAALLVTVMVLAIVGGLIAAANLDLSQSSTVSSAQLASDNEARTAALVGIAGFQGFLNTVQSSANTAQAGTNTCTNALCQFTNTLTNLFWGNSQNTVIPPNGGLGAIGYFQGQQVSINNVSLQHSAPYINATVSLHIIGNTYQIGQPATNNAAAQPPEPGLITVMSQGVSGQASATAQAVLGPVMSLAPGADNTVLSMAGNTTAGKIEDVAPASQHTYLAAGNSLTSNTPPQGFTAVLQGSSENQVTISANTLKSQSNLIFIPPSGGQSNPRIEFQNILGNSNLGPGPYRLSSTAISQGVCTFRLFGHCWNRVPIFAPNTSISYNPGNLTWTLSGGTSPSLLIPGSAWFQGNVALSSGLYDNAIISTGNIVDDATVYAPNLAGPSAVCGSSLSLFPENFCGPQGTQFIPASIGNLALYADGSTTLGNGVSVYGDVLSRGDLVAQGGNTFYGFVVGEGANNTLSGTTTINNAAEPETFNGTPMNADQYSATAPSTAGNMNEPIGLLGLTWIN
jgi:hypothetical protein